ncbi:chemotaxis protein CheW [Haliea sp. E1-2-M8]|uniref:chemotaxis protein CheW n=1 Tax=Haliea sp. E1-2-M8 TaxID=3064706 RepID=UPI0027282D01|nr:chemotaxis protein CheW [Haliea sp. E1-2-M8]MDO8863577.1 chemotaxis protein CheW [Haliea sp. E1-2-M8]
MSTDDYVIVRLDSARIGLRASAVDRVVQPVEITPLHQAPKIALGVINVHGTIIPVVNFRSRFGLPHREIALNDRLVIARTALRSLAFVADVVEGVFEYPESDITDSSTVVSGLEAINGIAKGRGDIVFIHDLELFLSAGEANSLDSAVATLRSATDAEERNAS